MLIILQICLIMLLVLKHPDFSITCSDKYHNPNVNAAIKAVELKGKLAGLYKNENENEGSGGVVTVMGSISVDGKKLDFNVGEAVDDAENSTSENP